MSHRVVAGCLVSLACWLTCCTPALGFSFPSAATASPLCPTFPTDPGNSNDGPLIDAWGSSALTSPGGGGMASTAGVTWTGGPVTVMMYEGTSGGSGGYGALQVQDASGNWDTVGEQLLSPGQVETQNAYNAPAGQLRLQLGGTISASPFFGVVVGGADTRASVTAQQDATVGCDAAETAAGQAHSDAQQLDTDLKAVASDVTPLDGDLAAVKDAVNGLTANGTTLDTLNVDLELLHSDLTTLDQDVKSNGAGGGSGTTTGTTTAQEVVLSPADRQLLADTSNTEHQGLWDLGGMALGLFCASRLGRLWSV